MGPIKITAMKDYEVIMEWITNSLAEKYPDNQFEIATQSCVLGGVKIIVRQTSGDTIPRETIQPIIDKLCYGATHYSDPKFGIFNRQTSKVSGEYIPL